MNVSLDGLNLGPLSLSWNSLTLALSLLTWFAVARFALAERAALVTLLVARLWAALPGLDAGRPMLENLLDIVDIRRGGWAWIPGLLAGALTLWWPQRRFPPRAAQALAITLVVAALPQLLKPAPQGAQATLPTTPLPQLVKAALQDPEPLPRGSVVNFWATWCGPCRAELPLLAHQLGQGEPIELVNVGEDALTISAFLRERQLDLPTWTKGEGISGTLGVTGFPTTLAVNASGQIVARHLGPLSGAQLQTLLKLAKGAP